MQQSRESKLTSVSDTLLSMGRRTTGTEIRLKPSRTGSTRCDSMSTPARPASRNGTPHWVRAYFLRLPTPRRDLTTSTTSPLRGTTFGTCRTTAFQTRPQATSHQGATWTTRGRCTAFRRVDSSVRCSGSRTASTWQSKSSTTCPLVSLTRCRLRLVMRRRDTGVSCSGPSTECRRPTTLASTRYELFTRTLYPLCAFWHVCPCM